MTAKAIMGGSGKKRRAKKERKKTKKVKIAIKVKGNSAAQVQKAVTQLAGGMVDGQGIKPGTSS